MKDYARKQIEELYKVGIDIREAESKKKGYSDGIKKTLTGLYPDNAHFVFELLQNAEDTGATNVDFKLTNTSLIFTHNGHRLFSKEDVDSITNIGDSSKLDDPTKIGKFGIGFKAVFAYTMTPRIYSGDFWFEIRDLICPCPLETSRAKPLETLFEFPFNNPQKTAIQCFAEIAAFLRGLKDNVLLFLHNIQSIGWSINERENGGLSRERVDNNIIKILNQNGQMEPSKSFWLRFEKDVEVTDDNGDTKDCRIAIAYSMVEAEENKKKAAAWKIVPLDHGQVSIFFPAEKETSNLRFHLHAPFASTVARDSVRECEANNALRDHLSELVVESLTSIRDMGMLTVAFLAVLPNPYDNLSNLYKPIQDAVVKAFQEQELTPTKSGDYATTSALFTGPAKIADVLGDEGLAVITGYDPPLWAANPPPQHQRSEHLLESLEIDEWGWNELVESLHSTGFSSSSEDELEKQELFESWVCQMKDDKLLRFYALLGEAYSPRSSDCYPLSSLRIIRVNTENADEHLKAREVFLPPVVGVSPPLGI